MFYICIYFHSLTLSASVAHWDSCQPLLSSPDSLLVVFSWVASLTSLAGRNPCTSAGVFAAFLTLFQLLLLHSGCLLFFAQSWDSWLVSHVLRTGGGVLDRRLGREVRPSRWPCLTLFCLGFFSFESLRGRGKKGPPPPPTPHVSPKVYETYMVCKGSKNVYFSDSVNHDVIHAKMTWYI